MKLKSFILGLVGICFSFGVMAGEREASGTVQVFATSGKMFVKLSGSNENCGNRYWFDPAGDYEKSMLSMLLAAQMSGKRVWVNGSGNCETDYPYGNAYKLVNMVILND